MICYKDRTYCPYWEVCAASDRCSRPLTDEVIVNARKWWGSDEAPICTYGAKPECFKLKEIK